MPSPFFVLLLGIADERWPGVSSISRGPDSRILSKIAYCRNEMTSDAPPAL